MIGVIVQGGKCTDGPSGILVQGMCGRGWKPPVAWPGFVERRGKAVNFVERRGKAVNMVMGHSRRTLGLGAAAAN